MRAGRLSPWSAVFVLGPRSQAVDKPLSTGPMQRQNCRRAGQRISGPLFVSSLVLGLCVFTQAFQGNPGSLNDKGGKGSTGAPDGFLYLVNDIIGETDGF